MQPAAHNPCSAAEERGRCVVKVGGSLLSDKLRLRALLTDCTTKNVAIVPGGGPFADAVRTAQAALGFDDALAHRLALDAMGRMAEVFCALEPQLAVAASVEAVASALAYGRCVVWDPAALKAGCPDIPESWAVTSDSLALWLATRLGADRCILEKSAPVPVADVQALAAAGLVDAAFPRFAALYPGEITVRGPASTSEAA
ncbi:uridylate kinase [Methylobacterium sp. Leaf456]|uniref:amino acid kinase family protein n=1 Tax=Methylobacterium sp. Leaf456 TaxID=1736382 RepID=UPI000701A350|nr:uridylate kinase [Methylobacterium sp. Leaf456]KQT47761.1 uridylate kinase [Methylobacterium sp. Leaf456]